MMANPLTRWFARHIAELVTYRVVTMREPDFIIGGADNPYLYRWWAIPRNPVFNVYLHCTVRDDDDRALHDHPWPSVSLCLDGHLAEVYRKRGVERIRDFHPGDIVWRGPWARHRLFLPNGSTHAWTLFVTGPRIREWGFWCPQGFRGWREFTAHSTEGDSSRIGRGCE